jgi:dipeptidyl aminopeptidase/acylaminoacyl peptidase
MEPEKVKFTTYDEVELAAHLYLPEGGTGDEWLPGIVVCHGFGSSKERHAAFCERATAAGYAALAIDLRGHGESGGEIDANLFNDVAAAVLYLQNRREVNPMRVAVRGSSMGGWLAIHTAAHLGELFQVVAYCPPNDAAMSILMEEAALVQRGHTSPQITVDLPRVNVNSIMQLIYRLDIGKAARRICPRPLLLVHCENDEQVPAHISRHIYDEAREPKTLWLLPGCDHEFAQHDPATDTRVLNWLRDSGPPSNKLSPSDMLGG